MCDALISFGIDEDGAATFGGSLLVLSNLENIPQTTERIITAKYNWWQKKYRNIQSFCDVHYIHKIPIIWLVSTR